MATTALTDILSLKNWLGTCLVGRRDTIDTLLTSMIANEHCYFIGPPGTGKSLLAGLISKALTCQTKEIQFSRRTTEDEVFGPLDIKALVPESGPSRYVRVKNPNVVYAQDAEVLIMDEPANASPAILKGFHALLQERKYHDGEQWSDAPLRICIGTSNEELPDDCFALRDRFSIKKVESYLNGVESALMRNLHLNGTLTQAWANVPTVKIDCFNEAHQEAKAIKWSKGATKCLTTILANAEAAGIKISDRTQLKCLDILRAFAYYQGASSVRKGHLIFAKRILWDELVDREGIHAIIDDCIGADARQIAEIGQLVEAWFDEGEITMINQVAERRRQGEIVEWSDRDSDIARGIEIVKQCMATGRQLVADFDDEDTQQVRDTIKANASKLVNDMDYLGLDVKGFLK